MWNKPQLLGVGGGAAGDGSSRKRAWGVIGDGGYHFSLPNRRCLAKYGDQHYDRRCRGVVGGTILATYRGHSVPFYAAGMGANYAIASLVFFGTEGLLRKARGDKRDALGYAGAGWVTGMAMTLPIGGRYQALVAGVAMAGVGYGGFFAHRRARAYLDQLGQDTLRRREAEGKGSSAAAAAAAANQRRGSSTIDR